MASTRDPSQPRRVVSPDYPVFGLNEATGCVLRLFSEMHMNPATSEHFARALGYSGLNGASTKVLASLKKYGFVIKGVENLIRLTELVPQILFPQSPAEKVEALRKAALSPPLFAELAGVFEKPPGDTLLQSYLIRKGFSQPAARKAATAYRETIAFLEEARQERPSTGAEASSRSQQSEKFIVPPSKSALERASPPKPLRPENVGQPPTLSKDDTVSGEMRRLFDYNFEDGGGVSVLVRGNISTQKVLDSVLGWAELKRRELASKSASGL